MPALNGRLPAGMLTGRGDQDDFAHATERTFRLVRLTRRSNDVPADDSSAERCREGFWLETAFRRYWAGCSARRASPG
jgi:hypothetical protein